MLGGGRLVTHRLRDHLGVLATAALTALAVAMLVVAASVLAPGVADNGFRSTIAGEPGDGRVLRATTAFDAATWHDTDRAVHDVVARVNDRSPDLITEVAAAVWTPLYELQSRPDVRVALGTVADPRRYAELVEGRWPADTADRLEVAVHADAMSALETSLGGSVTVRSLVGGDLLTATVVGVFRPRDPDHAMWTGYGHGMRPGVENQPDVFGPVIASIPVVVNEIQPVATSAAWTVSLALDDLTLADADDAIAAMSMLTTELAAVPTGGRGTQMSLARSSDLLERASIAATSARAVLLVVIVMLTALGTLALAFTARLVATRRAPATALLRVRGAGAGSLIRWSALSWLLPAVAVAVAAPAMAALALLPLEVRGALAAATTTLSTPLPWLVSVAVALGWLAMLVVADTGAGRSISGVSAERTRPRRAAVQRAGLDVLAIAVGVLALQQLRRSAGDTPELVLVVAPTLLLLGATVIVIRLLPWVARAASWLSARQRGLSAVLGSFELSRRAVRHTAAATLVVLALAVSVFAATTQATWATFRDHSVDLAEPADVRVVLAAAEPVGDDQGTTGASGPIRAEIIGDELAQIDGVAQAMPVYVETAGSGDEQIQVIGVESTTAATVMRWDSALAGGDLRRRLMLLERDEPAPALVTRSFAERLGLRVGDDADIAPRGSALGIRVAGMVAAVPGATAAEAILVDERTLTGVDNLTVDQWWLALSADADPGAVAAAAAQIPDVTSTSTHADALQSSADDPVAGGVSAGLAAGLAFASVFLLIGVVVHAVASFQSRAGEFAVLRAIGLARAGTLGAVAVEQGLLLLFTTLVGLGLGVVAAWLSVRHTVGGLAGLPQVPPLQLSFPWPVFAAVGLAMAALLAGVVLVASSSLRRGDVTAVLRAGEEA